LPFQVTWAENHIFLVFGACEVYIVRMLLDLRKRLHDQGTADADGRSSSSEDSEEQTSPASNPKGLPRVETTKKPAFLPASTTERPFAYIPYPHTTPSSPASPKKEKEKEYAIFAIAGTPDLPPVLIRKDIDADLGGWVPCNSDSGSGSDASCLSDSSEPSSPGPNAASGLRVVRVVGKDPDAEEEDDDMKGKYSCNALSFQVPIRSGLAWNQRVEVECGAMA
jgi:hypothetical protein